MLIHNIGSMQFQYNQLSGKESFIESWLATIIMYKCAN